MSFKNKVVIIVGGSSGIGAATAIEFAKESASIAIVGRNEAKLTKVSEKCKEFGSIPLIIIADISKDEDAKTIVAKTVAHFGKLDILINNAGISSMDNTIKDPKLMVVYDRVMAINLRAVFQITSLAVPELIKTKGNVVNISSTFGTLPMKSPLVYSVSKAGMDHFTRCVALELASDEIRVNTVSPGPVRTDFMINLGLDEENSNKAWDGIGKNMLIKGIAEAKEVADLIIFLASDKAKSVTGATYPIDRGSLLTGCTNLSQL